MSSVVPIVLPLWFHDKQATVTLEGGSVYGGPCDFLVHCMNKEIQVKEETTERHTCRQTKMRLPEVVRHDHRYISSLQDENSDVSSLKMTIDEMDNIKPNKPKRNEFGMNMSDNSFAIFIQDSLQSIFVEQWKFPSDTMTKLANVISMEMLVGRIVLVLWPKKSDGNIAEFNAHVHQVSTNSITFSIQLDYPNTKSFAYYRCDQKFFVFTITRRDDVEAFNKQDLDDIQITIIRDSEGSQMYKSIVRTIRPVRRSESFDHIMFNPESGEEKILQAICINDYIHIVRVVSFVHTYPIFTIRWMHDVSPDMWEVYTAKHKEPVELRVPKSARTLASRSMIGSCFADLMRFLHNREDLDVLSNLLETHQIFLLEEERLHCMDLRNNCHNMNEGMVAKDEMQAHIDEISVRIITNMCWSPDVVGYEYSQLDTTSLEPMHITSDGSWDISKMSYLQGEHRRHMAPNEVYLTREYNKFMENRFSPQSTAKRYKKDTVEKSIQAASHTPKEVIKILEGRLEMKDKIIENLNAHINKFRHAYE